MDEIPAVYDLFAVCNHFGRFGFGHYTAFARDCWGGKVNGGIDTAGNAASGGGSGAASSDEWHVYDDSSVRPMDASDVVSAAANVLFYKRREEIN
jgi:ubiquitin C-terminal hydrolase